MPELDKLLEEMLRQRPDLDGEKILQLIEEKKKKVGAGYLTDSGAAFLVASDLNVSLDVVTTKELHLKDLYIGANEVTVVGRVLVISPSKSYHKKDGSEGHYRRFTVYDKEAFITITLWDDKTSRIEELNVTPGSIIRIQKGYVKAGLDGRPIIHIGNRGDLELVVDNGDVKASLPSIEDITQDVSAVNTPEPNLVLTGLLKSPSRLSTFTRKDGSPGKVLQLYLNSLTGTKSVRVAVWDNDSLSEADIPTNAVVRLVGVRSRLSQDGLIEVHGNEGTFLQVISVQKSYGETGSGRFRVLSIGKLRIKENGSSSASLLITNESGSFYTLVLKDQATEMLSDIENNGLIDCEFKEISPTALLCTDSSSIRLLEEAEESFPNLDSITSKVKDIKESPLPLMVEVIALSRTTSQNILTKSGENVTKSEAIVGDETKEIRVIAWRDLTDLLEDIAPGQRLRLIGVVPTQGFDGAPELQIKAYSQVERIS
jgi:ssDNA-binding replication factor A large subunit